MNVFYLLLYKNTIITQTIPQVYVLGHYCLPLGVDCNVVHCFKHAYQEVLGSFLQGKYSCGLKTVFMCEQLVHDFFEQALKRQLSDQQLCAALVFANLPQRHCARPKTSWFANTAFGVEKTSSRWSFAAAETLVGVGFTSSHYQNARISIVKENGVTYKL